MPAHRRAVVCGPGEGDQLGRFSTVLKAGRDELGLFESVVEPGEGNSPHIHREHADAFYVLDGTLEVFVGAMRALLPPGALMVAPPGVSHCFRNPGPGNVRSLNFHAPGERFIALARARARGETPEGTEFDVFAPVPGGEGVVSGPAKGERLRSDDGDWLVKAELPQLSVFERELVPGAADRGRHYHERHVEAFYVLEGSLEFTIDGSSVHASAGTSVLIPPGVTHALGNAGSGTARVLSVHAPESGYANYLRARARADKMDSGRCDVYEVD